MPDSTAFSRAVSPVACELRFLPVRTRTTLSFGHEQVNHVICARVCMTVEDRTGRRATGWGETPLNVQWAWPGGDYSVRLDAMKQLCIALGQAWPSFAQFGHPMEVGHAFNTDRLPAIAAKMAPAIPQLAQLVCNSAFDVALHDAFGKLHDVPVYDTYTGDWLSCDLSAFYDDPTFSGRYPADYLVPPERTLLAWHMIGAVDAVTIDDLTGVEPADGYPVCLTEWIKRDGLRAIKIKLRGNDQPWDIARLTRIGKIAMEMGVPYLSADFNCTANDVDYVNEVLDALQSNDPDIFNRVLYIEQPFGYDLDANTQDVRSIARRKPILLDESAHDWQMVKLGRSRGWTGVALKTCKTQTNAILSLCWARAHQMQIMVQDLTNPMLAIIPHVQLASHAGTIAGVEVNACQFYPEASALEARVHPGVHRRSDGRIDLSTLTGAGFGYAGAETATEKKQEPRIDTNAHE